VRQSVVQLVGCNLWAKRKLAENCERRRPGFCRVEDAGFRVEVDTLIAVLLR